MVSAWASVLATTKSTPFSPALIMLLTALPPPPPTPNTLMRGLSSVMSGFCKLMVICLSSFICSAACRRGCHYANTRLSSETVLQPAAHPLQSSRSRHPHPEPGPYAPPSLDSRHLRIDHQSHR